MQGDGFVKDRSMENTPSPVPRNSEAKQGGDVRARWAWTEPSVWTKRMLTALDEGVKGNFFADHGLFCLTTTHGRFRQSPRG